MNGILIAILVLAAMGAVFGLLLAIAARAFHVEVDERQEQIQEVLPGANCGGCGYAGCANYAAAVVKGEATNLCAAGGDPVACQVAAIMGVEAQAAEKSVAFVRCFGTTGQVAQRFIYSGISDCMAAARLGGGGGPSGCKDGCLGMGSCVAACPFDAIHVENGVAKVDAAACVGCMKCADACPKKLIVRVPASADAAVRCASQEKGKTVRRTCEAGCIGCTLCSRACPTGAITVTGNLASVNTEACVGCMLCVETCPRDIIRDLLA